MSSALEGVSFRQARLDDYEEVLALGNMYGGRDYLFALYKSWMENPEDHYGVVAIADNAVVGFYLSTSFDGGLTSMKRAARVAENFRGRGIFQALEAELDKFARDRRPLTKYDTFAIIEQEEDMVKKFLKKGYKEVYRKSITNKIIDSSQIGASSGKIPDNWSVQLNVEQLTANDLTCLFHEEDARPTSKLFPKGRLLNFYLGYRLLDDNVRYLLCERGGVFASALEESTSNNPNGEGYTLQNSEKPMSIDSVENVAMVTFHFCFHTQKGFLYFLDVYSRPDLKNSRRHFHAHLSKNLSRLQQYFPSKKGILTIAFDSQTNENDVFSSLKKFGIEEELPNQETVQVLYERKLDS